MRGLRSLSITSILAALALPVATLAQGSNPLVNGFIKTGREAGFPQNPKGEPKYLFETAFLNYVNGTTIFLGVFFFIRVLYGGWLWMTARGNEEQVTRAKSMILHAVIAMAIVISARMIVELVVLTVGPLATSGT